MIGYPRDMRAPTPPSRCVSTSRRGFIGSLAILGGASTAAAFVSRQDRPAALAAEIVRDFVASAHSDVDAVRQMVKESPALVLASHDWGGGDFETGLNAASHVGRRDIAEVLLDAGARLDLFAMGMLGELDLLRPIVEAHPTQLRAPGPHGFTLLHCATRGEEAAASTVDWLKEQGLTDMKVPLDQGRLSAP